MGSRTDSRDERGKDTQYTEIINRGDDKEHPGIKIKLRGENLKRLFRYRPFS